MKHIFSWATVALGLSLGLVGCQKQPDNMETPDKAVAQQPTQKSITNVAKQPVAAKQFDYTPTTPIDGVKMGVGAIGSSELTLLVIETDKSHNWNLVDRGDDKSLMNEGASDETQLKQSLKNNLKRMADMGVKPANMHFIISSGAKKSGNADMLISSLKSSGYVVNVITPEQEGKYAFKATVPPAYQANSFMVDIGSGNTKISWEENGQLKALEGYGAKYYQKQIAPNEVYNETSKLLSQVPEDKRKYCFIIGGVPYSLAKPIRQNHQRFVVLNKPETYTPEDEKQQAGLNIYNAIDKATEGKTDFVFDFDSHYAIGFLQGLKH